MPTESLITRMSVRLTAGSESPSSNTTPYVPLGYVLGPSFVMYVVGPTE
jgi:hypothetical protein